MEGSSPAPGKTSSAMVFWGESEVERVSEVRESSGRLGAWRTRGCVFLHDMASGSEMGGLQRNGDQVSSLVVQALKKQAQFLFPSHLARRFCPVTAFRSIDAHGRRLATSQVWSQVAHRWPVIEVLGDLPLPPHISLEGRAAANSFRSRRCGFANQKDAGL
uniref:Uncharacterized protein n=1 Tax=Leersia perrieri TaxID=77586 RepID=A0A0D9XQH0_9ORYZ